MVAAAASSSSTKKGSKKRRLSERDDAGSARSSAVVSDGVSSRRASISDITQGRFALAALEGPPPAALLALTQGTPPRSSALQQKLKSAGATLSDEDLDKFVAGLQKEGIESAALSQYL